MIKFIRAFNIAAYWIDWVNKYFSFGLLMAVFLCIMLQVFFNYVLSNALSWTQEMSRILLVWLTFFGAALVTRRKLHIGLTMLVERTPQKIQNVVMILGYIVTIFFIVATITHGWRLSLFGTSQTLTYLNVSYFWCYVGIPVGATCILVQILYLILNEGLSFFNREELIREFEPDFTDTEGY